MPGHGVIGVVFILRRAQDERFLQDVGLRRVYWIEPLREAMGHAIQRLFFVAGALGRGPQL